MDGLGLQSLHVAKSLRLVWFVLVWLKPSATSADIWCRIYDLEQNHSQCYNHSGVMLLSTITLSACISMLSTHKVAPLVIYVSTIHDRNQTA